MSIEKLISFHIEKQFPAIYREDGRELVEFVKEYYKFLERDERQTLYNGRRIYEYRDIDTTLDRMLIFFKNKYLADLPFNDETIRLVTKNILGLYRRKGTQEGLQLFFRLFYDEDIKVYYPARDIFRPSDSEWNQGVYLEILPNNGMFTSPKTTNVYTYRDLLGRTIVGEASRSRAIVDKINFILINNTILPIVFINKSTGDFIKLENIICEIDGVAINFGTIKGSLQRIQVNTNAPEASLNNNIGDLVVFQTAQGIGGEGLVTDVTETFTGFVNYEIEDGGWGYSVGTTRLEVSNQIVFLDEGLENPDYATYGNLEIIPGERVEDQLGNTGRIIGRGDFGLGVKASGNSEFTDSSIIRSLDRAFFDSYVLVPNTAFEDTYTIADALLRAAIGIEPEATKFNTVYFSRKLGDLNGDGLVRASDALEFIKYVQGVQTNQSIINYIEGEFLFYLRVNPATFGMYPPKKYLHVKVVEKNDSSPGDLYPDTANTSDVIVGELSNKETISLIFDVIDDFKNVQLNSSNYNTVPPAARPMSGATDPVTINTPLEDAFDLTPFEIGTIVRFDNIDPGIDYVNDVYAIAEDSRIIPTARNNQLITLVDIPATISIGDEIAQNSTRGKVLNIRDKTITVRPYSYYGFNRTDPISYGGSNWAIASVSIDFDSTDFAGKNAIINSVTDFGIGKIKEIRIVDSGYGYVDREPININILKKDGLIKVGEGTIDLGGQGTTGGFWSSLDSHLNGYLKTVAKNGVDEYFEAGKRIQDSNFYQEYSYEIQSTVDIKQYEKSLKEITHVAGTKVFGKFNLEDLIASNVNIGDAVVVETPAAAPEIPDGVPGDASIIYITADSTTITADR